MRKILLSIVAFAFVLTLASCTKSENKTINFDFKAPTKAGIVAEVGDFKVTDADLSKGIEDMLKKADQKLFLTKLNRIRAFIIEHFMSLDPRKKDLNNDEYLEKYIVKGSKVSSREISEFAKKQQISNEALSKGGMKDKVKQFLLVQKKREKIDKWMQKLSKKHNVVIGLKNLLKDDPQLKVATSGLNFGTLPEGNALQIGSELFPATDLFSSIKNDLYEAETEIHNIKLSALKSILVDHFAKKLGGKDANVNEYLEKNVYSSIEVSKEDVDAFAKERKIPETAMNEQLITRIKDFIGNSKKKVLLENWLADQGTKEKVVVYFMPPARPVFEINTVGGVFAGGEKAKVVIAEFTDFQCPFCAKGSSVMKELKAKYGDKIKVVFKHFPLPFHEQAKFAHEVAYCASEQGNDNFWNLYYKFFGDQSKLSREQVLASAKALKVDMKKVDTCLGSGKASSAIQKDFEEGQAVGVNSTPTFFVNGKLVMGAQPLSVFSELIDEELKKQN